jgi:hypothetical protein
MFLVIVECSFCYQTLFYFSSMCHYQVGRCNASCIIQVSYRSDTTVPMFNEPCTAQCQSLNMICVNHQCKCNTNKHFFWTGARCLECPELWTMSGRILSKFSTIETIAVLVLLETACIGRFDSPMSWSNAQKHCQNFQAELLSLHNGFTLSLIHQEISKAQQRIKLRASISHTKVGWTSAYGTLLTDRKLSSD